MEDRRLAECKEQDLGVCLAGEIRGSREKVLHPFQGFVIQMAAVAPVMKV